MSFSASVCLLFLVVVFFLAFAWGCPLMRLRSNFWKALLCSSCRIMESVLSSGTMLEVKGPCLYFRRALLNVEFSALTLAFLMAGGIFLLARTLCLVAAS